MTNTERIKELNAEKNRIERGADRLTNRDRERISEINSEIYALMPKKKSTTSKPRVQRESQLPATLERIRNLPKRGIKRMVENDRDNQTTLDLLKKLREPFPKSHISLLPKPTRKDNPKGKCPECGGYHGLPAVHIRYVGHAALTDRLLDVDPFWNWEPVSTDEKGFPSLDEHGGMWIYLTVCGVTRRGYGDAGGKMGADANKERIGDALRNAAMRFGAALDLWHKGDLHISEDDKEKKKELTEDEKLSRAIEWIDGFVERKVSLDFFDEAISGQEEKFKRLSDNSQKTIKRQIDGVREFLTEIENSPPETKPCPAGGEVTEVDCEVCEERVCEKQETIDFKG